MIREKSEIGQGTSEVRENCLCNKKLDAIMTCLMCFDSTTMCDTVITDIPLKSWFAQLIFSCFKCLCYLVLIVFLFLLLICLEKSGNSF
jgi:hypothetical protein